MLRAAYPIRPREDQSPGVGVSGTTSDDVDPTRSSIAATFAAIAPLRQPDRLMRQK